MLSRRRFLQMCGVSLAAMAVGVPVVAAAGSIPVLLYHRIGDSDDKITAKTANGSLRILISCKSRAFIQLA